MANDRCLGERKVPDTLVGSVGLRLILCISHFDIDGLLFLILSMLKPTLMLQQRRYLFTLKPI